MTYNFLNQQTSISDAAGTGNFIYDVNHRLAIETNLVIVNGGISYTYDTYGRRTVMSFGNGPTTFANSAYTYDPMGRVTTFGNGADTLTCSYVSGTNTIGSSAWQTATLNTAHTYDSYKFLTGIAVNNVFVCGCCCGEKIQWHQREENGENDYCWNGPYAADFSGAAYAGFANFPSTLSISFILDFVCDDVAVYRISWDYLVTYTDSNETKDATTILNIGW